MPKTITVTLLVNEDDDARIAVGLYGTLREIMHPMGSGFAQGSFILDYALLSKATDVAEPVRQAIAAGNYEEGSAFEAATDHYLLIMEGDIDPTLEGPFATDDKRLVRAREFRSGNDEDGVYRLDVPAGTPVEVSSFSGGEIEVGDEVTDGLVPDSDYVCNTWFERDRKNVRLEKPDGTVVFDLWDEDVGQAIEDGFLTTPRHPRPSAQDWQPHAIAYARGQGLLQ